MATRVERIEFELLSGQSAWQTAACRYAVLGCQARLSARHDVVVLAWGMGPKCLRIVVRGPAEQCRAFRRAFRIGTCRLAAGGDVVALRWTEASNQWFASDESALIASAAVWAHCAAHVDEGVPTSPWSSQRDVIGLRRAAFFNAGEESERRPAVSPVDPASARSQTSPPPREPLSLLLRIAGAVLGVLPADRRCFQLFVQLADARGWRTAELASALRLTARRIRQLASGKERLLDTALRALQHADVLGFP